MQINKGFFPDRIADSFYSHGAIHIGTHIIVKLMIDVQVNLHTRAF